MIGKDEMPIYANLGRDSNVYSYELGSGWIEVTFKDGVTYRYDDRAVGAPVILTMQQLARDGHGLSAYINSYVRKRHPGGGKRVFC